MAKQTFVTGDVLTAAAMNSLQQTAMGGGSTTAKTSSYTLVAADAGTVVQMNSASATTITVNTALFAAGDTVQIQNIGTGVCTVTAGTATVNTAGSLALSQYEGGQLYFNTTSAALFFDIVQASLSPTWSSYTVTITPGSGSFTSASATGKSIQIGKMLTVNINATLTTIGTAAGDGVSFSLPQACVGTSAGAACERAITGQAYEAQISSGGSTVLVRNYAGGSPYVAGSNIFVSVTYEVA